LFVGAFTTFNNQTLKDFFLSCGAVTCAVKQESTGVSQNYAFADDFTDREEMLRIS
jgi:hypothetical protein